MAADTSQKTEAPTPRRLKEGREKGQIAKSPDLSTWAGMLAAVALGELTFDDIPDRVSVTASYRPDPATAGLYTMLFGEFVGLYKRNRKAYARLNGPGPGG